MCESGEDRARHAEGVSPLTEHDPALRVRHLLGERPQAEGAGGRPVVAEVEAAEQPGHGVVDVDQRFPDVVQQVLRPLAPFRRVPDPPLSVWRQRTRRRKQQVR